MVTITAMIMGRTLSTRVPRKLIRDFGGTTILDIALEKLNRMDFVDSRYLAVAEDELAEKCNKYSHIEVMWRKPESILQGDVAHTIRQEHYTRVKSDYILIFNPCHPFIELETLKDAISFVRETKFNSYTSVIPSVDWIFNKNGDPITNKNPKIVSTTETGKLFKVAHAFHVIKPEFLRKNGLLWSFTKNDPCLLEISEKEALDIDTELEFTISELLYNHTKLSGCHV